MPPEAVSNNLPLAALAVQETSLSPSASPLLGPGVQTTNAGDRPQRVASRSTGSVSFATPGWQENQQRNGSSHRNGAGQPTTSSGTLPPTKIYWKSPASMVACFFLGILVALGHHLYYNSLKGDLVGDQDEQQRKLRFDVPIFLA